jgi:hypothetical protein
MRRILCAGSGISQERRAIAEAGFDVVALDISPQAIAVAGHSSYLWTASVIFVNRDSGGRGTCGLYGWRHSRPQYLSYDSLQAKGAFKVMDDAI